MASSGTSDGVGDLVQESVENRFRGAVLGVILGDLDAFRAVFAHTQTTFRICKGECPTVQTVLRHLPAGNGFQFFQVHDSPSKQEVYPVRHIAHLECR
jgi:hypothetical protein